jgi:hypothetical protein
MVLLLLVSLLSWWVGNRHNNPTNQNTSQNQAPSPSTTKQGDQDNKQGVKALVHYSLPDGWHETTCNNNADKLYFLPPNVSVDCNADPSAPVSMAIDPAKISNCQELGNQANVQLHTCKSTTINGKLSLQSSTTFNPTASNKHTVTVNNYYISTNKQVVKIEYQYQDDDNQYQSSFDAFAQTVTAK